MNKFHYKYGDQVVLRRIWNGKICRVTSATVVQDTPVLVVLYWGAGYPLKVMKNPLKVCAEKSSDVLSDVTWKDMDVIMLATPGAGYAVYAMRREGQDNLEGWYINLQEPLHRTTVGFDTMDYLLDITVTPDRCEWHWKDETDFMNAVNGGMISPGRAHNIRMEGDRAIQSIQEGSASFYDKWANWIPPKDWEIPQLPVGWDKI